MRDVARFDSRYRVAVPFDVIEYRLCWGSAVWCVSILSWRRRLRAADGDDDIYPLRVSHCAVCKWFVDTCRQVISTLPYFARGTIKLPLLKIKFLLAVQLIPHWSNLISVKFGMIYVFIGSKALQQYKNTLCTSTVPSHANMRDELLGHSECVLWDNMSSTSELIVHSAWLEYAYVLPSTYDINALFVQSWKASCTFHPYTRCSIDLFMSVYSHTCTVRSDNKRRNKWKRLRVPFQYLYISRNCDGWRIM